MLLQSCASALQSTQQPLSIDPLHLSTFAEHRLELPFGLEVSIQGCLKFH